MNSEMISVVEHAPPTHDPRAAATPPPGQAYGGSCTGRLNCCPFCAARRVLHRLVLNHAAALEGETEAPFPWILLAIDFSEWADMLSSAPPSLRHPDALRDLLERALAGAQKSAAQHLTDEYGPERASGIVRDFARALDREAFADTERAFLPWLDAILPRTETGPADGPTAADLRLRAEIDALSTEERSSLTYFDVTEDFAVLRDLSPLAELRGLSVLHLWAQHLSDLTALAPIATLENLDLEGRHIDDLRPLANVRGLRELRVGLTRARDLAALAELTELEELELDRCPYLVDLTPLARLPRLRSLAIRGTPVRDFTPLTQIQSLRHLTLEEIPATLAPIGELAQLESLTLDEVDLRSLDLVRGLTQLSKLRVVRCPLADIEAAANLSNLEKIDLGQTPVTDVSALARLTRLRTVELSGTDVRAIDPIASLPELETLDLSYTRIGDVRGLDRARKLRVLRIEGLPVHDLRPLSALTELEELRVDGAESLYNLEPLRGLRSLTCLKLDRTSVRDLSPLSELVALERVMLSNTLVESLEPLARLPELRYVDVCYCRELESIVALAGCVRLEDVLCLGSSRVRGPRSIEDLRAWREAPRLYPSAGYHANPRGAVPAFDARNHLPSTPPAGWSVPLTGIPGRLYTLRTPRAIVHVLGEFVGEHPHFVVTMAALGGKAVTEEVAADVLRHMRACGDFLEWTGERAAAWIPGGLCSVRAFVARAQRATADTWGAVQDDGPRLRVEPSDDGADPGSDPADPRSHLPSPLPEGWQVRDGATAHEAACRVDVPGAEMVLFLVKENKSDERMLGVFIAPKGANAPVLTSEAARALLTPLRRRGAFEEQATGENAPAAGARVFVARVGGSVR